MSLLSLLLNTRNVCCCAAAPLVCTQPRPDPNIKAAPARRFMGAPDDNLRFTPPPDDTPPGSPCGAARLLGCYTVHSLHCILPPRRPLGPDRPPCRLVLDRIVHLLDRHDGSANVAKHTMRATSSAALLLCLLDRACAYSGTVRTVRDSLYISGASVNTLNCCREVYVRCQNSVSLRGQAGCRYHQCCFLPRWFPHEPYLSLCAFRRPWFRALTGPHLP